MQGIQSHRHPALLPRITQQEQVAHETAAQQPLGRLVGGHEMGLLPAHRVAQDGLPLR